VVVAAWAVIPWLNAGANLLFDTGERSAVWDQSTTVVILNYAALSFAVVVTLVGAERLARRASLRDDTSILDPSLALRPFGAAAFTGLWLLLVWMVPLVVTGLPDVTGLVIGLLVLAGGLAAFVFSLWGLHRQIVEVKENQLALARDLYAEAYEPVRQERTLEALDRRHSLLGAADALEKRARAIHDWPVAEGTWAWVIGIATSVVAIACSRLILRPLGF
jgi:hypothetical protein